MKNNIFNIERNFTLSELLLVIAALVFLAFGFRMTSAALNILCAFVILIEHSFLTADVGVSPDLPVFDPVANRRPRAKEDEDEIK